MWACYLSGQNQVIQEITFVRGESQDFAGSRNHDPARPKMLLGITANSQKHFEIVSMLSLFENFK